MFVSRLGNSYCIPTYVGEEDYEVIKPHTVSPQFAQFLAYKIWGICCINLESAIGIQRRYIAQSAKQFNREIGGCLKSLKFKIFLKFINLGFWI